MRKTGDEKYTHRTTFTGLVYEKKKLADAKKNRVREKR